MRAAISYETTFAAEHQLRGRERHTNAFRLGVVVEGPIVGGVVVLFETIESAVANLLRVLDAVPPTEALPESSSVEEIAVWIWGELRRWLPELAEVRLSDGAFTVTYRGGA
jgi:6-pyruvoyl-tetrahydropterin synthase